MALRLGLGDQLQIDVYPWVCDGCHFDSELNRSAQSESCDQRCCGGRTEDEKFSGGGKIYVALFGHRAGGCNQQAARR